MTQARFALGRPDAFNATDYDQHMTAQRVIAITEDGNMCLETCPQTKQEEEEVALDDEGKRRDSEDASDVSLEQDDTVGSRDTNLKKDVMNSSSEAEGEMPRARRDPLFWFGVLVPPTLRQAQSDFVKSVQHMVALTNVKRELNQLHADYLRLYKATYSDK